MLAQAGPEHQRLQINRTSDNTLFLVHFQVVQEYERAVIFRLGRALPGARGPGNQVFMLEFHCQGYVQGSIKTDQSICSV